MTTALYAGSFDPFHVGHLSIVERAAASFDEVVIAVVGNPAKQSGLFPVATRVELIDASTAHLDNVRCVTHHGLTVDVARACGADLLVRSSHKERSDELTMAFLNERMSGLVTWFVAADVTTAWISATLVRDLVAAGRHDQVHDLVPPPVFAALPAT